MSANYHKIMAAAAVGLCSIAPGLPLIPGVIAGFLGASLGVLARPGRVSKRLDRVSRAIPGVSVADKRIDEAGAEIAGLIERSRLRTGEQSER